MVRLCALLRTVGFLALTLLSTSVGAGPAPRQPDKQLHPDLPVPWMKPGHHSISATATSATATTSTSSTASAYHTAPIGSPVKPKILLIANTFEFGYLSAYNFTTAYTGPLFDSVLACARDGQICKLECGQELVSASQITAMLLIPGLDFSGTYIFISGTGGVNPKYGTAGGVAISKYCVQWEWGGMFLGADLPSNFSSQYFYAYAQDAPNKYPTLVGSEVYELNAALVDRFYALAANLTFQDVEQSLQSLRATYQYAPARRAPFLAKCDTVSSQVYWHGAVAGENVEYYTDLVTSGGAKYCNTNEDDQGRVLALVSGAKHGLVDFGRVVLVKAFSNFDRPPPQLSAFQSRFFVGEAATAPGLYNMWKVVEAAVEDVLGEWEAVFDEGIAAPNYIGDAIGSLGGTPEFVRNSSAVAGSVQGS